VWRIGTVHETALPLPKVLATQITPPCRSIESATPKPPIGADATFRDGNLRRSG
jgi:hypothetical protein